MHLNIPLVLVVYNTLVFCTYAWDKIRAIQSGWRVPEESLLWMAALLGAPGALAGIFLLRHKTRKPKFTWGVSAMMAIQAAGWWFGRHHGWW